MRRSEDEVQLLFTLEAFAYAHHLGMGWADDKIQLLKKAGITNLSDLSLGVRDDTINLDLELFGIESEDWFGPKTLRRLACFLPGPVGFRCMRLARMAAMNVKKGLADTEYTHRSANGSKGDEVWSLSNTGGWVMKVDCAGFVRNCLKHVTKDPFRFSLTDRDFMRAKDFFVFFSSVPYTVMASETIPEIDRLMKWRKFTDLRLVIPGDVICYRPRGNAAGGAAFTGRDRKDLGTLLKAVKTSEIWHSEEGDWRHLVARNVAKDPKVSTWVKKVKAHLNDVGITTVKQLHRNLDTVNSKLREKEHPILYRDTLNLIRECCESTATNTGHIVFASGPAVRVDSEGTFRIRVVHSTKFGAKDPVTGEVTEGVQEYYRKFYLQPDGTWTKRKKAKQLPAENTAEVSNAGNTQQVDLVIMESEEDPLDDMEEQDDEDECIDESEKAAVAEEEAAEQAQVSVDQQPSKEAHDDVSGADCDVIVARMCF